MLFKKNITDEGPQPTNLYLLTQLVNSALQKPVIKKKLKSFITDYLIVIILPKNIDFFILLIFNYIENRISSVVPHRFV